jgi:hypothetical protein
MLAPSIAAADDMSPEELERWFLEDADDDEARALAVNEGPLVFLPTPPDKPAHHSHNTLTIDDNSLSSGWVKLGQCHRNLDPVPASQVVYRYHRMRGLRIESSSGIERVWVEDNSVQLSNVHHHATLCVSAEVGILYRNPDNSYSLRNGPFHRKFLDGYYPMQVTLDIHYPAARLQIQDITPTPQPGFSVSPSPGRLLINTWFEGELRTELRFTPLVDKSTIP